MAGASAITLGTSVSALQLTIQFVDNPYTPPMLNDSAGAILTVRGNYNGTIYFICGPVGAGGCNVELINGVYYENITSGSFTLINKVATLYILGAYYPAVNGRWNITFFTGPNRTGKKLCSVGGKLRISV